MDWANQWMRGGGGVPRGKAGALGTGCSKVQQCRRTHALFGHHPLLCSDFSLMEPFQAQCDVASGGAAALGVR